MDSDEERNTQTNDFNAACDSDCSDADASSFDVEWNDTNTSSITLDWKYLSILEQVHKLFRRRCSGRIQLVPSGQGLYHKDTFGDYEV